MLPEYLPWYHPSRNTDCSITEMGWQEVNVIFFKILRKAGF